MRRIFVGRLAVVFILFSVVLPASAAPRRDDSALPNSLFEKIQKIVKIVKHILPLEDVKVELPKP